MTDVKKETEFDARRGRRRVLAVVMLITFVAAIGCMFSGLFPIAIVCGIVTGVSYYQIGKYDSATKKMLGDAIELSSLCAEIFDHVEYNPNGSISETHSAYIAFPFLYDREKGCDDIKAVYQGMNVEMSDIELSHMEDVGTKDKASMRVTVFKGQWLVCDLGRELPCTICIAANTRKLWYQYNKKQRIMTENSVFNERFAVFAKNTRDSQEAHTALKSSLTILTPSLLESILSASDKIKGEIYISFLHNGKVHIAVNTKHALVELNRGKTDIEKIRESILNEIQWFAELIDGLRIIEER